MPWSTPTLKEVRGIVRDDIRASLPGADASIPNSVLRVLGDAEAGLCHLNLQYIDWLALQLLPDTAETEWLDRHGDIWLVNADGSKGRKQATFASGSATFTGVLGAIVPLGTQLSGGDAFVGYETTADITIGTGPTETTVIALDPGSVGNVDAGTTLMLTGETIPNVDSDAVVVLMDGGVDVENDDDLRFRVLQRIQNPPMGGSEADYVRWTLAVAGVTRAWAATEQGVGTITVRFLMDELRADDDGWPTPADVEKVALYIDKMRPVTVKDCYVVAPVKQFIDVTIVDIVPDETQVSGAVEASLRDMLHGVAKPGQTIFAAWINYAIMNAPGVQSFKLLTDDDQVMETPGHMAVLGTILFQ